MKRILYIILPVFTIFLASCETDREELMLQVEAQPVLLDTAVSFVELDSENLNNPALSLQWEDTDYGVQTAVQYELELSTNADFTESTIGASTASTSVTWSVRELNNILGSLTVTPFAENEIYFRVLSTVGNADEIQATSNAVSVTIVPFYSFPFLDIYLVGAACLTGWDNGNVNPPLVRNPNNTDQYSYTGFFNADQFKFLETRGQWQPQWGTNDGSTLDVNRGDASDPGEFETPTQGYYVFSPDLNEREFTLVPYEGEITDAPDSITISGSATADADETTLEKRDEDFDPHVWRLGPVRLVPGEIQFSVDGTMYSNNSEFSGDAMVNGSSIPVGVADDYEIWYYSLTNQYHLIPLTYTN